MERTEKVAVGPSRTGIRNNSGEIVGEKWILSPEQADEVLSALEARHPNYTECADLFSKLTGEPPDA